MVSGRGEGGSVTAGFLGAPPLPVAGGPGAEVRCGGRGLALPAWGLAEGAARRWFSYRPCPLASPSPGDVAGKVQERLSALPGLLVLYSVPPSVEVVPFFLYFPC